MYGTSDTFGVMGQRVFIRAGRPFGAALGSLRTAVSAMFAQRNLLKAPCPRRRETLFTRPSDQRTEYIPPGRRCAPG